MLSQVKEPVIIHWLGDMFDPRSQAIGAPRSRQGDGHRSHHHQRQRRQVDGVKVSLLDKQREIDMRRRLDKKVKSTPAMILITPN